MNARGGRRIGLLQAAAQGLAVVGVPLGIEPAAQVFAAAGAGSLEEPPRQRFEVEPRAARHDGHAPPGLNIGNMLGGLAQPIGGRPRPVGLGTCYQMARHARQFLRRRLRRTDREAAIDLHRIGRNDLSPQPPGQSHGEGGLARGRGPGQKDQRW
jgi:hypothetical protein